MHTNRRIANPHTGMFQGGGRKPENNEEALTNTRLNWGRTEAARRQHRTMFGTIMLKMAANDEQYYNIT